MKSKGILLIICIVLLIIGSFCIFYFTKDSETSKVNTVNTSDTQKNENLPTTPDEIWPENGKIIALIDGKEYRYDPIYLYRLTGINFSENKSEPLPEYAKKQELCYSSCGTLFGNTQQENAIFLELLYIEGKDLSTNNTNQVNSIKTYLNERKSALDYYQTDKSISVEQKNAYLNLHNEAKFQQEQDDNDFFKDLAPYGEKYCTIDNASASLCTYENISQILEGDTEQLNAIFSDIETEYEKSKEFFFHYLMNKYEVEMIE